MADTEHPVGLEMVLYAIKMADDIEKRAASAVFRVRWVKFTVPTLN